MPKSYKNNLSRKSSSITFRRNKNSIISIKDMLNQLITCLIRSMHTTWKSKKGLIIIIVQTKVQQVMVAAIEANRITDSIDAELTLY
jgi:hypothetical protein